MKRLLSLLTLTALLATTACSAGEGSAVLSDTAGTSAPTAATPPATSPEEPSEPEPEPDYPEVSYVRKAMIPQIDWSNFYTDIYVTIPQFFIDEKTPTALCLVTLTGLDTASENIRSTVRIDRIEMQNPLFKKRVGDEIAAELSYFVLSNVSCAWQRESEDRYILYYNGYDVPMGEFGKQYYVFLTGDDEKPGHHYWMFPLSVPLPTFDGDSGIDELSEYFDSCYDRYYFPDESDSAGIFEGKLLSQSTLKFFYNHDLEDPRYDMYVEEITQEYGENALEEIDFMRILKEASDSFVCGAPDLSQYFVRHDA